MSEEDAERLTAELRELFQGEIAKEPPPKKKVSGYELIVSLLPEIDALLARNRTRAEIVDLLASKGVKISLGSFGTYYAKAHRELEGNAAKDGSRTTGRKRYQRKPETGAKEHETPARTPAQPAGNIKPNDGKKTLGGFGNKFAD